MVLSCVCVCVCVSNECVCVVYMFFCYMKQHCHHHHDSECILYKYSSLAYEQDLISMSNVCINGGKMQVSSISRTGAPPPLQVSDNRNAQYMKQFNSSSVHTILPKHQAILSSHNEKERGHLFIYIYIQHLEFIL